MERTKQNYIFFLNMDYNIKKYTHNQKFESESYD